VSWQDIFPWIYFAGVAVMLTVSILDYHKLKRRVREAWIAEDGCWECPGMDTAFVLGFLPPRIYLPVRLTGEERSFILSHEKNHIRCGHHWYKMIGYGILAVHWINPLIWLGYALMCRDIEMACDEQVIRDMSVSQRKAYSEALLNCCSRHGRLAACPVSFGDSNPKKRILSVLHYKKPGFWITLLGGFALVFVAVCLLTSPKEKEKIQAQIPQLTYTSSDISYRVSEQFNPTIVFGSKTEDYESNFAVYHFDPAISKEERDACVFYSDEIISRMELAEKPVLLLLANYDGAWTDGKYLYLGGDFSTVDYGAKLITTICGGYANYGAAYGYADYIAVSEGWKEPSDGLMLLTPSDARDMNVLCFRKDYVSDNELQTNRTAAAVFASDMIEANGEEAYRNLILSSGNVDTAPQYAAVLSDWYAANGLHYVPSHVLYCEGGTYHDYLVKCPYAEFVLPKQWNNGWVSEFTKDSDFLHRSYEETKFCFETNIYQMEYLRQYIGFDNYIDDLTVEFSLGYGLSETHMYEGRIELYSIEDLPILYVYWLADHSLRDPIQRSYPLYAGMAHHISLVCPNVYKESFMQYIAENGMQAEMYMEGDWNELFIQMLEGVTDPYTIQRTRFDFGAYYFDDYYDYPAMGMYCSFPWYLIDKYGYETMFDYVYVTENPPIVLDMAAEKQEWIAWIEETYSDYPKYSDYLREERTETVYICWDQNCTDQNHDHTGRDCTDYNCTDSNHHHEQANTNTSQGHHHDH